MGSDLTLRTDNIIAPIRGEMIDISGEDAVKRLARSFSIAVMETPKLLECDPQSIQKELLKCCADGLVPDGKEAVILPYFDKDKRVLKANYQPMVYGVIKRMKELGSVTSITVEVVHGNDNFHVNLADVEDTTHELDIFSSDRGEIVAAYCIARDKDRRVIHREIMPRSELDKIRQASKSPNSPAWKTWESEMFKKGVLRRLSKYIALDNDNLRQMIERIDELYDFRQRQQSERLDPFAPKQIESSGKPPLQPDEVGGDLTGSPSTTRSSARANSSPARKAEGKASDGSSTVLSDASQSAAKPLITLDEIQAFSDHLWGSGRTKRDVEADSQQFKAKNWSEKKIDDHCEGMIAKAKQIHQDRVEGANVPAANKRAADRLAELGFDIPKDALEDA